MVVVVSMMVMMTRINSSNTIRHMIIDGPLRKTIEDASRDREAMVQAKEYVTSVEEMRAFVREFLKPNPHGGVAESAVLPNLPTLEDEMLVTL
mmetsp:Transcript_17756/g.15132  ORF Transcript_17756/g.15132 Transcript_17756/m.15132 type:complete len:93 (-) Transcript_17756:77-355(-)